MSTVAYVTGWKDNGRRALFYSKMISHGMQIPIELVCVFPKDDSIDAKHIRDKCAPIDNALKESAELCNYKWHHNRHSLVTHEFGETSRLIRSIASSSSREVVVADKSELAPEDYQAIIQDTTTPILFANQESTLYYDREVKVIILHDGSNEGIECFGRAAEFAVRAFVGNGFRVESRYLFDENEYPPGDPRTAHREAELRELGKRLSERMSDILHSQAQAYKNAVPKKGPKIFDAWAISDKTRLAQRAKDLSWSDEIAQEFVTPYFSTLSLFRQSDLKQFLPPRPEFADIFDSPPNVVFVVCRPCLDHPPLKASMLPSLAATVVVVP